MASWPGYLVGLEASGHLIQAGAGQADATWPFAFMGFAL